MAQVDISTLHNRLYVVHSPTPNVTATDTDMRRDLFVSTAASSPLNALITAADLSASSLMESTFKLFTSPLSTPPAHTISPTKFVLISPPPLLPPTPTQTATAISFDAYNHNVPVFAQRYSAHDTAFVLHEFTPPASATATAASAQWPTTNGADGYGDCIWHSPVVKTDEDSPTVISFATHEQSGLSTSSDTVGISTSSSPLSIAPLEVGSPQAQDVAIPPPSSILINLPSYLSVRPKKFWCSSCGKGFTQKGGLINHERIHRNERPFQCSRSDCRRAFVQKCNLTRHERCHTGERPYVCPIRHCLKAFNRKWGLTQHMRLTHEKDKEKERLRLKAIEETRVREQIAANALVHNSGATFISGNYLPPMTAATSSAYQFSMYDNVMNAYDAAAASMTSRQLHANHFPHDTTPAPNAHFGNNSHLQKTEAAVDEVDRNEYSQANTVPFPN